MSTIHLGTISPSSCPRGTYRSEEKGKTLDDCYPCPPGKFCLYPNSTTATDDCSPGYYCPSSANITNESPTGFECPKGFYCEQGFEKPEPCKSGCFEKSLQFLSFY